MARTQDTSLLEAALAGYQAQSARITAVIADLQKRLGKRGGGGFPGPFTSAAGGRKRHRISAEGRARIAAAQRARWAAKKKKQ